MSQDTGSSSTGCRGRGFLSLVLIAVGAALLVVGAILVYPYVRSRLVRVPAPASTLPPPPPTPTVAFLPLLAPPTATAAVSTEPPGAAPTAPVPPTVTPAPALPTRIVIPAIDVDAPVVEVSLEPADVDGQAQAVPGNTVLNGHNTTNGEVFRDLYTLEASDAVTVYAGDTPYTYAVSEILILPEAGQPLDVRLENARYILPTGDERLTLVTCHPYGSLRNRLIVVAFPAGAS